MEQLSSYVPADRLRALARGATLPGRAVGTALFADISGFTPLTEALVLALGPQRGAEELPRQLNLVYDALITEIHRYSGSVIGFAGDAITCWFDDASFEVSVLRSQFDPLVTQNSKLKTQNSAARAAACALAIQAAMQ